MIVNKFGGDCLGKKGENAKKTVEIIKNQLESGEQPVVITSAFSGVTDNLVKTDDEGMVNPKYRCILNGVLDQYGNAAIVLGIASAKLSDEFERIIGQIRERLAFLIENNLGYCEPIMHQTISLGERLSARLLSELYSRSMNSVEIPPSEDFPVAFDIDNNSVDQKESRKRMAKFIHSYFGRSIVPVLPGFLGTTKKNVLKTLGRGGSDESAVIISQSARSCGEKVRTILWKNTPYGCWGGKCEIRLQPKLPRMRADSILRRQGNPGHRYEEGSKSCPASRGEEHKEP
jgi:aspartate kinase